MADFDQAIGDIEKQLSQRPDYALQLIGLAEVAAGQNNGARAFELAKRALGAAGGDPRLAHRAQTLFRALIPRYHLSMMNDELRNQAWNKALVRAVKPGSHVLEIGTGAGMLALMAARAGAGRVTTCEKDPIVAAVAREIASLNGYGDRIQVITKSSAELVIGTDMDGPAELLFCDIFADTLIGFDPLAALADARRRLLAPQAKVIPAAGAIRVALAHWSGYDQACQAKSAAGFDITPFARFAPAAVTLTIGDPRIRLLSEGREPFRFDFTEAGHAETDQTEVILTASRDCVANGIVQWIRLELDAENVLESRPKPEKIFFSAPLFYPFDMPLERTAGEQVRIGVAYQRRRLELWVVDRHSL